MHKLLVSDRSFKNSKRSHDKINASLYAYQAHTISINAARAQLIVLHFRENKQRKNLIIINI